MKITDNKKKHALLLYQAGEATQEIFNTLQNTGDDYQMAQQDYFTPRKNMSIFKFSSFVKQLNLDETIDQFATILYRLRCLDEQFWVTVD